MHILELKQVVHEAASSDRAQRGCRRVWGEWEAGPFASDLNFVVVITDQKAVNTFLFAPSLVNNLDVRSLNIKEP